MRGNRRVTFIAMNAYSKFGGIPRFNQRVVDAVSENFHSTTLLLSDKGEDLPKPNGAALEAFAGSKLKMIWRSLKLGRKSDVILVGHINLVFLAFLCKAVNPRLKLVLFVHGVDAWGEPPYRTPRVLDRYFIRYFRKIASVSSYTASRMAEAYGVPTKKFTILPNAVDFPPEETLKRTPPEEIYIICVSRLDMTERGKNIDKVIRAMSYVCQTYPSAKLGIVGRGDLMGELKSIAENWDVGENVVFHGRVSDSELSELYSRATALVLPSSKEGFGIVYLEAWSHGVPVIASKYGAAPEVVEDGQQGFVVDPDDELDLALKIKILIEDHALNERMGKAGRDKVESQYLQENFRANVASLMDEL